MCHAFRFLLGSVDRTVRSKNDLPLGMGGCRDRDLWPLLESPFDKPERLLLLWKTTWEKDMLLIDAELVTPPLKLRRANFVRRDFESSMPKFPPVEMIEDVKCPKADDP